MLNVEVLQNVISLLEVRPELVNLMSSGFKYRNFGANNLYQLVAYVAEIKPPATGDNHWKSVSVFGECTKVLGITQDQSYRLFHSWEWPIYSKMLRELHDPKTLEVMDQDKYSAIICKYLTWYIKEYPNVCL